MLMMRLLNLVLNGVKTMGKRHEAALKAKPILQKGAQTLSGAEALQIKKIYPQWKNLVKLGSVESEPGFKFLFGDDLYSCIHENPKFQADWIPGQGTESEYTRIDETHAGTIDDPIPYEGNMALQNGKYYSQDGVKYLCTRDTVNPVHHALADLVGLYVEVA